MGAPAIFSRDGDDVVPEPIAAGPWDPGALHGGPPAALMGRAVQAVAPDMFVARLTVELEKPVPMAPLTVEVHELRPGRRVKVVEATLRAGRDVVARSRALLLAESNDAMPDVPVPVEPPVAGPDGLPAWRLKLPGDPTTFGDAMELRPATGRPFVELGDAAVWFALQVPLFAGEPITALDRALTAADFPNGISNVLPFDRYVFINPDLTVHLHRPMSGEWVLVDARTRLGHGHGLAEARLADQDGTFGFALQSLVVRPR